MPWPRSSRSLSASRVVVGRQHAAVAVAAEVLGRIEAEAADVAERAGAATAILRADRLAGVFDHRQSRASAPCASSGVHVGALAVQMDGNDRLGLRRDERRPAARRRGCTSPDRCRRTPASRRAASRPRPWRRTCSWGRSLRRRGRCRTPSAPAATRRCPRRRRWRASRRRTSPSVASSSTHSGPSTNLPERADRAPARPEYRLVEYGVLARNIEQRDRGGTGHGNVTRGLISSEGDGLAGGRRRRKGGRTLGTSLRRVKTKCRTSLNVDFTASRTLGVRGPNSLECSVC